MDLRDWIGRTEAVDDVITSTPVAALAATLDRAPERPAAGTILPPLWHWLYFLPLARLSDIGPDGHPRRGGFLPPVPLPRRMWAGSQFRFHEPLRVGDEVARLSTIEDVTEKQGRSGTLVFVRVRHEIRRRGAQAVAITEHHDIVYRDAPQPGEAPAPAKAAPATAVWRKRWTPDDVLLFRYSALTFNGHRIHYDRRYVTEVEGYPGLVVHGPLLATLMLDLLRSELPSAEVVAYEFRALRPTFDTAPFDVCGAPNAKGGSASLWIQDLQGNLAMTATATLR
jgi:3-methylfumaryl-CoA hydratase